MVTYTLTATKIKTRADMEHLSDKLDRNAYIKSDLIEKWDTWFNGNEYYKEHRMRSDGIMCAMFTVKINGLNDTFDPSGWHLNNRQWFLDFIHTINEYSFILTSAMSFNKDKTGLFENIIVVSPTQCGRLAYRPFFILSGYRQLQKSYATFMKSSCNATALPVPNPGKAKISTQHARGLLNETKDLPVKRDEETDDEYYSRVNNLFHLYCARYQSELKKSSLRNNELAEMNKKLNDSPRLISKQDDMIQTLKKDNDRLLSALTSSGNDRRSIEQHNKQLYDQLSDFISVSSLYGGTEALKIGMRFSLVIKYARRFYKDTDNKEMMRYLDKMVTDGEKYAKEIGVNL